MRLKYLSAVIAGLSLAFAGQAFASGPVTLSESQLDTVVAGTGSPPAPPPKHHKNKGKDCGCAGGGLLKTGDILSDNKFLNNNNIASYNKVNVLSGNNAAIAVGAFGVGANASYKN